MNSRRLKIGQYKQALARSEKQLKAIIAKRDKLRRTLQNLNAQHESGRLTYLDYSKLFDRYLAGRSVEEWEKYYAAEISRLQDRVDYYNAKISDRADRKAAAVRTIAATLTVLTLLAAFGGLASIAGVAPITSITGFAVSESSNIVANATVEVYFAYAASNNLSAGIQFNSLQAGMDNQNATGSYNSSNLTEYYLAVSSDSNVNVDFCTKADADFEGPVTMSASKLSIANSTTNSASAPALADEQAYSTSVTKNIGSAIAPGANNYLRFWIDIAGDQVAGDYNNSVTFKAVQTATTCSI